MRRGIKRNIILVLMWGVNLTLAMFCCLIVWLDRKIKFRFTFPRDTAELAQKEKWCIRVLKENGILPASAVVTDFKIKPMKQELIFRSDIGVEISYRLADKNTTLKFIAKFAPIAGTLWNRAVFNLQLNHIKEIYFNRYFANEHKYISTPVVYYTGMSVATGNFCLLMEFMENSVHYLDCVTEGNLDYLQSVLGAKTAEEMSEEMPEAHFELALNGLASLHAFGWKSSDQHMNKIFPIVTATVDFFDSMVAGKWSIPARQILVQSWCRMNDPQTILHGDARVGNMMFPSKDGSGRFVLIDWQAVRKGKGVYDLAYFLLLSLSTEKRKALENKAIAKYYDFLISKGVRDYSREDLQEDYQHACLCVLVLLSLPMLSGEASAERDGALIFAWGMNIWRERLKSKFSEFDYQWMSSRYGITPEEGSGAVAEMNGIIARRLEQIKEENK